MSDDLILELLLKFYFKFYNFEYFKNQNFTPGESYLLSEKNPEKLIALFLAALNSRAVPILYALPGKSSLFSGITKIDIRALGLGDRLVFGTYTSGTSGEPEIILHGLREAGANAIAHANSIGIEKKSVIYQTLPLYHAFGIVAFLFTPALLDATLKFSSYPGDWLDIVLTKNQKNFFHLIPKQIQWLQNSKILNENVIITVGAGVAPKSELDKICRQKSKLYVTYGLTEAGPRVSSGLWTGDRPQGWIGEIFSIVDWKMKPYGNSNFEELFLKTPSASLSVTKDSEGFFSSGDLFLVQNESLIFKGRKNQSFKLRGELYTPEFFKNKKKEYQIFSDAYLVLESLISEVITIHLSRYDDKAKWQEMFRDLNLSLPKFGKMADIELSALGKINKKQLLMKLGYTDFTILTMSV